MIKTGVWTKDLGNAILTLLIIGSAAVYVLTSIIKGLAAPNPLELFLWHPIILVASLLALVLANKYILKKQNALDWDSYKTPVIFGLLLSFAISTSGLWTKDIVSSQLGLAGMAQYLVSLGVFPFNVGPDAILRGFAWGVAGVMAYQSFKNNDDILNGVLVGIVACTAMNIIFLLPNVVINLFLIISGTGYGDQLVTDMGVYALNSYWSNAQIVRWFSGFGGQTVNSIQLFTISWVFITGFIFWLILFKDSVITGIKTFINEGGWRDLSWMGFSLISGAVIAWGRSNWVLMDFSAVLVFFIIIFIMLLYWKAVTGALVIDVKWLLFFYVFGGFVLGWPVFIMALLLLGLIYLSSNNLKASLSWDLEWLKKYILALGMSFVSFQFIRRGGDPDAWLSNLVVVISFFNALFIYIMFKLKRDSVVLTWLVMLLWLLISGLTAIMFGTFLPVAITLIGCVILFIGFYLKKSWLTAGAYLVVLSGLLILFMVVLLPKLLNPRLLPS